MSVLMCCCDNQRPSVSSSSDDPSSSTPSSSSGGSSSGGSGSSSISSSSLSSSSDSGDVSVGSCGCTVLPRSYRLQISSAFHSNGTALPTTYDCHFLEGRNDLTWASEQLVTDLFNRGFAYHNQIRNPEGPPDFGSPDLDGPLVVIQFSPNTCVFSWQTFRYASGSDATDILFSSKAASNPTDCFGAHTLDVFNSSGFGLNIPDRQERTYWEGWVPFGNPGYEADPAQPLITITPI